MKSTMLILLLISCCLSAQERAGNLIVLFDWSKERITYDLNKPVYDPTDPGFGPPSTNLLTALAQKAAPILVTSSIWHNFVGRRAMFKDFLEGRGAVYAPKYLRFAYPQALQQFQQGVQAYFQPHGQQVLGPFGSPLRRELDAYFLSYCVPFEAQDWLIKKVSDYIYLLIPQTYLAKLRSYVLPSEKPNIIKPLSDDELRLNLKIESMPTMSYQDALNPDKHALTFDRTKYQQLLKKKDAEVYTQLETKFKIAVDEAAVLSKHFIKVLSDIFVTRWDLKDKQGDPEKTELYRALYLYPWHLYLNGHGSPSSSAPLKEINLAGKSFYIEFAYLAGIELLAFRQWLGFLNDSIRTDMLLYVSCYSGGQHLQKVYEHQWDYPAGKKATKTEVKQDVFNYTIVVSNLAYTVTWTGAPTIEPPWKNLPLQNIKINYVQNFYLFFNACDKYFSMDKVAIGQKQDYFEARQKLQKAQARLRSMMTGQPFPDYMWNQVYQEIATQESILNGLTFITLNGVVDFVIDVAQHQPAVRYPGADSFVPLPLNEQEQLAARIRFESQKETQQRKKEEERSAAVIKKQAEQHIAIQKGQKQLPETVTKVPAPTPQVPAKPVAPQPSKKPLPAPAVTAPADTKLLENTLTILQRKLNGLAQMLKKR